jgi:alkylated DNA nucleotide flippase Atl1
MSPDAPTTPAFRVDIAPLSAAIQGQPWCQDLLPDGWPDPEEVDEAGWAQILRPFVRNLCHIQDANHAAHVLEALFQSVDGSTLNDCLFQREKFGAPCAVLHWFHVDAKVDALWRRSILTDMVRRGVDFSSTTLYEDRLLSSRPMSVMAILLAQAHQITLSADSMEPVAKAASGVFELLHVGVPSDATAHAHVMHHMNVRRVQFWLDVFQRHGGTSPQEFLDAANEMPFKRQENIAFVQSRIALDAMNQSPIHHTSRTRSSP